MNLLQVDNLSIRFPDSSGGVEVVHSVSFNIGREIFGIVGESGSGKTLTGRAIMRLIPPPGEIHADHLIFDGMNLCDLDDRAMGRLRGTRIGMVMQDPRYALNPVMTVGKQIGEVSRTHQQTSAREAREHTLELLAAVRINDPNRVYSSFPHELSGGMGQRVMIAMMLIASPDLLIADEPTSALDANVRGRILGILKDLVEQRGMSLIFISHDLNLVASFCDRVLVMYDGRVVETLRARDLSCASHPYTRGLLASRPHLASGSDRLPVLSRAPGWLKKASNTAPR